jgi:xylan 1,4-beta-xylosidase
VKNLLENMDNLQSFGYWTITDLIEEQRAEKHTFHGGLGLITQNNIPKAAYYAYEFLGKLGEQLVAAGEGYFITKNRKGYQIILYHYCHYDRLYCMNQHANIDRTDRYNVFLNKDSIQMKLTLNGIEKGNYIVKQNQLNRKNGSAFDKWVEMGAPEQMNIEEMEYLRSSSVPKKLVKEIRMEEGYIIEETLQPHEVQLIEIVQQKTF